MKNGLIISSKGHKAWYQNDKLHRTDGPAIEYAYGDKAWYQNGKLHRTDGPAVEYSDGGKAWYLGGQRLTYSQLNSPSFMEFTTLLK